MCVLLPFEVFVFHEVDEGIIVHNAFYAFKEELNIPPEYKMFSCLCVETNGESLEGIIVGERRGRGGRGQCQPKGLEERLQRICHSGQSAAETGEVEQLT